MSVSWICKFLSTIHMTLLEDSMISGELDQEEHEVSMRHNMWTHIQWLEEMIHDCFNTHSFQFESWMCFWSWLVQSCPERCALTIW